MKLEIYFVALSLVLVAACGSPSYAPCAIRCGAGAEACPLDMTCGMDGFCHTAGESSCTTCVEGACSSLSVRGGIEPMGATPRVDRLQIVEQGFAGPVRMCSGKLCVRGGLVR